MRTTDCAPQFDFGKQMLAPFVCTVFVALALAVLNLDQAVADVLYRLQGGDWVLRNHPVTEALLHKGGKRFSIVLWLAFLVAWIASTRLQRGSTLRRPLAYVLCVTLISTIAISVLKHASHMDCPWDLARYGGDRPFVGLFELRPANLGKGVCWPAGHASAGYSWVALYFYFLAVSPRWRWLGLIVGLGLGAVFGFSQQLRGAHFMSHDFWTLWICWSVAAGGYWLMISRLERGRVPATPVAFDTPVPN